MNDLCCEHGLRVIFRYVKDGENRAGMSCPLEVRGCPVVWSIPDDPRLEAYAEAVRSARATCREDIARAREARLQAIRAAQAAYENPAPAPAVLVARPGRFSSITGRPAVPGNDDVPF